jgi:hypothetical protein
MINNLLSVVVLAGLVGTFVLAPAPEPRPDAPRPPPSATADVAAVSPTVSPASTASYALPSRHPPVPLMRAQRASLVTVAPLDARAYEAEGQTQDALNRTAAKSAIEADGYKGVTVLGKGADGTWRAKAYRGNTEVQVTVDGTGRVSIE